MCPRAKLVCHDMITTGLSPVPEASTDSFRGLTLLELNVEYLPSHIRTVDSIDNRYLYYSNQVRIMILRFHVMTDHSFRVCVRNKNTTHIAKKKTHILLRKLSRHSVVLFQFKAAYGDVMATNSRHRRDPGSPGIFELVNFLVSIFFIIITNATKKSKTL